MFYKFIRTFGSVIHYLWPYNFSQRIARIYAWFYSSWIASNFKQIGLHTKLEPGLYLVNGKKYIEIGDYCIIGRNSFFTALETPQYPTPVKISIGNGCIFGPDMHITAVNSISIGDNVRTGKSVLISDNSHGNPSEKNLCSTPPDVRPLYSKGGIIIGDNVWIGEKAAILAGVTIGKGSVIGANTVVTRDIPPFSVAVGIPARIINR